MVLYLQLNMTNVKELPTFLAGGELDKSLPLPCSQPSLFTKTSRDHPLNEFYFLTTTPLYMTTLDRLVPASSPCTRSFHDTFDPSHLIHELIHDATLQDGASFLCLHSTSHYVGD